MSLRSLFDRYPWRTASKFVPLAKRHGFSESEARQFLKEEAPHDIKISKVSYQKTINKYGDTRPSYQFDTLIQQRLEPYLVFININTRKAYAYKMHDKGKNSVLDALRRFVNDVPDVAILTSDRDRAYLTDDVLNFLTEHHIEYHTTHNNNHNILGIINRFMRTLRDMNSERDFTEEQMNDIIEEYNKSPHKGLGYKAPDEMNSEREARYVRSNISHQSHYINRFKEGDTVRVIQEKNPLTKRRSNLSKESYIVDGRDRNQLLIRAKDGSIDTMPAYRLVKADKRYKVAETILDQQRGVIDKITGYDKEKDKYNVIYDEGTKDTIPAKNLRETEPNRLSEMELSYWSKHPPIPQNIRRYI